MDGLPDADAAPLAAAPPQKRDEWSESGILRLLEAYEAKWLLRNRAKLKWSDWVDIAREVSVHCADDAAAAGKPPGHGGGSSAKTPNQCKNKVESMKKRYRAETAAVARASPAAAGLSWRFFARMDGLLKGPPVGPDQVQQQPKLTNGRIDLQAPAKPEAEEEADFAAQLQDAVPGAFTDLMKWTRMAPSRIKRRRLITACRRRAGLLIAMPTSVLRGVRWRTRTWRTRSGTGPRRERAQTSI